MCIRDRLKSDNAYYIYSASEWLEEMNEMINMVIIILTGIASISLLVGGIGIMNIMLVLSLIHISANTLCAPASSRACAQAEAVAPVVRTSSTSRMRFP